MKILIADDSALMRTSIKEIFAKEEDIEIVGEATNGKEAVQLYNSLNPDLVIMDITMPDMDGLQAINKIKQINPNAKFIVCSALGNEEQVKKITQHMDIENILLKPINRNLLLKVIKKNI